MVKKKRFVNRFVDSRYDVAASAFPPVIGRAAAFAYVIGMISGD